jgi:thiol-disulfide isomerase/thioredoxin
MLSRAVLLVLLVADVARADPPPNPALLDAASRQARGELANGELDAAERDAKAVHAAATAMLRARKLDDERFLPLALGTAIEIEAQVLAARGDRSAAIAMLTREQQNFADTSIATRLQKNLNLLTLENQPAPPLVAEPHLGPALPKSLAGRPRLYYFWADWCGDCKMMAPVVARVATELARCKLLLVAPTQTYGDAPADELGYIERLRAGFAPPLADAPVPTSAANFARWGASTVPTIVLVDKKGRVALYHPGAMPYETLAARAAAVCK